MEKPPGYPVIFKLHFTCDCGCRWQDEWEALCNDLCPKCGQENEPDAVIMIPLQIVLAQKRKPKTAR